MFGVIGYNQQDIIKDGLVLWLDASDRTSYPATGSVWRDLSRTYTSGSLFNGAAFDNINGGTIIFDGADDYVEIASTSITNLYQKNLTVELFVYVPISEATSDKYQTFISIHQGFDTQLLIGGLRSNLTGTPGLYGVFGGTANFITTPFGGYTYGGTTYTYPGKWTYVSMVIDYTNSNTLTYINGNFYVSVPYGGTLLNNNSSFWLGRVFGYSEWMKGNYSTLRMYNRALNATEVLQNYNTTKSRIGL